jgi:hypothetical protein
MTKGGMTPKQETKQNSERKKKMKNENFIEIIIS